MLFNLIFIFDLDGVIVTTDDCHFRAWKKMADEEGIYFDREINERLRGVSRMASLEIILERANKAYTEEEKVELATRKNGYYVEFIQELTPADILPGVIENIDGLKANGIKVAIGSSSKNTPLILKQIGLDNYFDAVSDGNNITKSKPDPEVFVKAADMLGVAYNECMVVEDADAGIQAGKAAGMKTLAVGNAKGGDYTCNSLADIHLLQLIDRIG
jgi:beta-phosphoglucomutase